MFALINFIVLISAVNAQNSNPSCKSAYCSACSGDKCTACISNYMLIDGKCVFEGTKNCRESFYDHFKNNYYNSNYQNLTHVCYTCNYGYKMDFNSGNCVKGEDMCKEKTYNHDLKKVICTKCEMGYALVGNECKNCTTQNSNCTSFDLTKQGDVCYHCKTCETGYAVVNGICKIIDPNKKRGGGCKSGFFEVGNYCREGNIDDCVRYYDVAGTICSECLNGGYQDGKDCISDCDVPNCKKCVPHSSHPICSLCNDGYSLGYDGQCYGKPLNCQSAEYGKCTSCKEGYGFDENNNCLKCKVDNCKVCTSKLRNCTSCKSGYSLNKFNTCVKCGSDCSSCDPEKPDYCSGCKMRNKKAIKGKCLNTIEKCSTYKDDGTCSICSSGYKVENGKCVEQPCLTTSTTDKNKCIKCSSGYYMKEDFTCGKCDKSCKPNGGCVHEPTMCLEPDTYSYDYCEKYNEKRNCIECAPSCELKDGVCETKEYYFYCKEYLADGKCGLCTEVYYDKIFNEYESLNYWPDRDGTCGAGSVMIYLAVLLLLAFILF